MKRIIILSILFLAVLSGVYAQDVNLQPTAIPVNPYLAGQGGSATANAHGYVSLFKNPAGFAMEDGDFTLVSANIWGFIDQSLLEFASRSPEETAAHYEQVAAQLSEVTADDVATWAASQTEESIAQLLTDAGFDGELFATDPEAFLEQQVTQLITDVENAADPADVLTSDSGVSIINLATAVVEDVAGVELMPSGNIRLGANMGMLGIVGGGLGLGANINMDAWLKGMTILDASGYAALTASATAGLGIELIPDFLTIGADVRPMYRVYVPLSGQQAMDLAANADNIVETMNTYAAYGGTGIGIDAGAILQFGDLNLGVTVTDLFDTKLNYQSYAFGDIAAALESGGTLNGTIVNDQYIIPMDILLGASYMLDLGFFGDLTVHAEVSNALSGIRAVAQGNDFDFLSVLHAGAYLNLFDFLGAMAGYNEGYLSVGAAAQLLFLDVSGAVFVKANGANVGYSDFGATIEAAIRF